MQLFPLKSLILVVHFLNAFWHGKETFPKSSSQNEIVPLLIVFHLPYSKYKGVKICFYSCRYKIKIFHSCRTRVVRVALVSHPCRSCLTCVTLVLLVPYSCCICVVCVALVSLLSGTRVVNQTISHLLISDKKRIKNFPKHTFNNMTDLANFRTNSAIFCKIGHFSHFCQLQRCG